MIISFPELPGIPWHHVKRGAAHTCPQVVIQVPINITIPVTLSGPIAAEITNSLPAVSDPNIITYLIIPGVLFGIIEGIWRKLHQ